MFARRPTCSSRMRARMVWVGGAGRGRRGAGCSGARTAQRGTGSRAQGRRTSADDGTDLTEYRYDAMGNLRAVQLPDGGRLAYRVDGLNRRVEKLVYDAVDALVRWERYTYKDQLEPVAMQVLNPANGSTTSVLYFVYGTTPHVPAYMVDDLGNHFAFVTDQVGSVRQVVEVSTGAVVHSMRYTAFGEVLEDDFVGAWPPQPFGYAGGLYDRETGFVRFGARDYDAFTRRWTAKDPIRFEGGDTNLFAYVGNNPVESVDPTGLIEVLEPTLGLPPQHMNPAAQAAQDAYDMCWSRRPDYMRTWGVLSNVGLGERRPENGRPYFCQDYASWAAECMTSALAGTGIEATARYDNGDLADYELVKRMNRSRQPEDHIIPVPGWDANVWVQYRGQRIAKFDPWWRLW